MRLHSPSWASSDSNSRRRCEVVQAIRTAYSRSVDFARWWVAALLVVVFTSQSATATDYRVNPDAPGPIHDGSSWQYAFKHLNDALNYSQLVSGDRIWVKQAVYSPGTGATDTFSIPSGVGVYGGFLGTEPNFNARPDPPTQTFLSGEDVNNHVIFIATGSDGTVLDGFVIEKGKASNTSGNASRGAGIFIGKTAINLVFKHCVVRECAADGAGGGLFANDDVSFDMAFCVFRNNTTLKRGGGINLGRVGPVNIQCTLFTNNHAVIEGGGLSIINTTIGPEVYSCEFRSNSAYLGGAVYVESLLGGSFGNCTVTENDAFNSTSVPPASGKGGAFYVDLKNSGTMQVFNSIIWGNRSQDANDLWEFGSSIVGHVDPPGDTQDDADLVSVTYSDIEIVPLPPPPVTPWPGTGNILADPKFVSPRTSDFSLKATSPCLDSGDDTLIPSDILDLDGDANTAYVPYDLIWRQTREVDDPASDDGVDGGNITNAINDMGAHERQ